MALTSGPSSLSLSFVSFLIYTHDQSLGSVSQPLVGLSVPGSAAAAVLNILFAPSNGKFSREPTTPTENLG